ncbi:hypothetical protein [Moorena bouillonii]|uniref:hypothetical protein n=1 Tax=Moorena bouillonii TaxID=207920 RepID=UPI00096A6919|nr:hypothetical protein [Moorena bouillonii]
MRRSQAIRKWIVSPDGTVVVQAESTASASGDKVTIIQEVTVKRDSSGRISSRSSSSCHASSSR